MSSEFLSVAEAADRLGVSVDHVRRFAPIVRLGRRTLVPEEWLDDLAHPVTAPEPELPPAKRAKATGRTFDFGGRNKTA